MKKLILLLTLFFIGTTLFAQPSNKGDKNNGQKLQALYIAYITKEIQLTEDEAQKFWPVHSQYDSEIKAAGAQTNELERQQAILNVKKKYQEKFIKIIGVERTNEFYKTDGSFREKMVQRLKKARMQKSSL